jgi:hypothetical protein
VRLFCKVVEVLFSNKHATHTTVPLYVPLTSISFTEHTTHREKRSLVTIRALLSRQPTTTDVCNPNSSTIDVVHSRTPKNLDLPGLM